MRTGVYRGRNCTSSPIESSSFTSMPSRAQSPQNISPAPAAMYSILMKASSQLRKEALRSAPPPFAFESSPECRGWTNGTPTAEYGLDHRTLGDEDSPEA